MKQQTRQCFALGIIAVGLLLMTIGALHHFLMPDMFEARARIAIETEVSDVVPHGENSTNKTSLDEEFMQIEMEKIRSRPVLFQVVTNLSLQDRWFGWKEERTEVRAEAAWHLLRSHLTVRQIPNASLIEIYARSRSPQEAAKIANAVAKAYKENRDYLRLEMARRSIEILTKGLAKTDEKISKAEDRVNDLQKKLQVSGISDAKVHDTTADIISGPDSQAEGALVKSRERVRPYFEAKRDLNELQKVHRAIISRIEEEKLPHSSPVVITDLAEPPPHPSSRKNKITWGFLLTGGLLSSLGSIKLRKMRTAGSNQSVQQ